MPGFQKGKKEQIEKLVEKAGGWDACMGMGSSLGTVFGLGCKIFLGMGVTFRDESNDGN